jgi:hydroxyacyl-ACP dehydratase HTD2-like protein with hotdog domain
MISPDSIGRTFVGTKKITVSQSEIDSFCAVIGETDRSVAPPTFSIRISLDQSEEILTSPEVGIKWDRLVHGDQKFDIKRPLKAGDVVRCDSTIESAREVAGNEIITVRSDISNEKELLISSWSTLVIRA